MVGMAYSRDCGAGAVDNVENRVNTLKMTMLESLLRALNWILPPVPFILAFLLGEIWGLTRLETVGVFVASGIVVLWLWLWLTVAILNKGEG